MTASGLQMVAKRGPKAGQNRTKNQTKINAKNEAKKNTSSRSSWHRFGTILGRFVTALGDIFIDFPCVFKAFRENSPFAKNIVSRTILSPTWPVLGRFWPPKMAPK